MKYTTNIFGVDSSEIVFITIGLDIIKNFTLLISKVFGSLELREPNLGSVWAAQILV